jgi:hypothetical protein
MSVHLIVATAAIVGLLYVYWFHIRPRGAHMLATYREVGGGWEGVKAVLSDYRTWWAGVGGTLALAAPDLLALVSGYDLKPIIGDYWGGIVGFAVPALMVWLRAQSATPSHLPPSGEA